LYLFPEKYTFPCVFSLQAPIFLIQTSRLLKNALRVDYYAHSLNFMGMYDHASYKLTGDYPHEA